MTDTPKYHTDIEDARGPVVGDRPIVFQIYGHPSDLAMERVEHLLKMLGEKEAQSRFNVSSRRQDYWKEKIPSIDWQAPFAKLAQVYEQLKPAGGAASFLVHNTAIGDDLFKRRLYAYLKNQTGEGNFRSYQIGFLPHDIPTPISVLNKLAHTINHEPLYASADELEVKHYTEAIVEKLCHAVPSQSSGHVVFFEFSFSNMPGFADRFLPWFVKHFWTCVLGKFDQIVRERRRTKFIFLLEQKAELAEHHLAPELCCFQAKSDLTKLVPISLSNWNFNDISEWMGDFGNLTHLQLTEVDQIAAAIYNNSLYGCPKLVRTEILATLETIHKGRDL